MFDDKSIELISRKARNLGVLHGVTCPHDLDDIVQHALLKAWELYQKKGKRAQTSHAVRGYLRDEIYRRPIAVSPDVIEAMVSDVFFDQ